MNMTENHQSIQRRCSHGRSSHANGRQYPQHVQLRSMRLCTYTHHICTPSQQQEIMSGVSKGTWLHRYQQTVPRAVHTNYEDFFVPRIRVTFVKGGTSTFLPLFVALLNKTWVLVQDSSHASTHPFFTLCQHLGAVVQQGSWNDLRKRCVR